jgi:hypothetical protein
MGDATIHANYIRKMSMTRPLLLMIGLAISLIRASGCDCVLNDVRGSAKKADAVFVGKVISINKIEITDTRTFTHFPVFVKRVEVAVERSFKGRIRTDVVVVYTAYEGTECGMEFILNERYVIYASRDPEFAVQKVGAVQPLYGPGIYWTNSCTRTRAYDEAEVKALEFLR